MYCPPVKHRERHSLGIQRGYEQVFQLKLHLNESATLRVSQTDGFGRSVFLARVSRWGKLPARNFTIGELKCYIRARDREGSGARGERELGATSYTRSGQSELAAFPLIGSNHSTNTGPDNVFALRTEHRRK